MRSGFAVMAGRSNVGKSTLMNALVGTKVAITTPKPQTTRMPIQGIVTVPEGQVVFVDTPGIIQKGRDSLTKKMTKAAKDSLRDVDVILHVVDPTRSIGDEENAVIRLLKDIDKPKFLVINKTDLRPRETPFLEHFRDLSPNYTATFEVSATRNRNLNELLNAVVEALPEGHPFYPEGQLTNMGSEQWMSELIREKLFLRLREEVPYSVHVEVQEMEKRDDGTLYIKATIFTVSERYKRMIIGAGGQGIKEIGQSTRRELETVTSGKVFLDLTVEVDSHWLDRLE